MEILKMTCEYFKTFKMLQTFKKPWSAKKNQVEMWKWITALKQFKCSAS